MTKPKLQAVGSEANPAEAPADAQDFDSLWVDQKLGDDLTSTVNHKIPIGKPKEFFRTIRDPKYRRRAQMLTVKSETAIDEQYFIIGPKMKGQVEEARPCTLVTVIYRDGSLRLWPIKSPRDEEKDNEAWSSARAAARAAMDRWVKLVWSKRAYKTREAREGYAPDPDVSRLPPFNELVKLAFGEAGIIRDTEHPAYLDLCGAPSKTTDDLDENADDIGTDDI